jgi:hypothetical protein
LKARESREILEPVRCTIQALYVHAIERIERLQLWRACEFLLDPHRRKRRRRKFVLATRPQFRGR